MIPRLLTENGSILTTESNDSLVLDYIASFTSIRIAPASVHLANGASPQTFAATAYDQFGTEMASQPSITLTCVGGGSFVDNGDNTGTLTPDGTRGMITGTSGSVSGNARVNYPKSSLATDLIVLGVI